MLSPYDIEVKKFDKGFRGYNQSEVDDFMQMVLTDYEAIYKENNVLKTKMQVLVEKIEEYKKIEDSLRNAIVSAQKMGENMIKDATAKSELVLQETNVKAERIISNINMQIYKEKQALEDAKRENQLFCAKLLGMYQAQVSLLQDHTPREVNFEPIKIEPEAVKKIEPLAQPSIRQPAEDIREVSYVEDTATDKEKTAPVDLDGIKQAAQGKMEMGPGELLQF